jgi:orotidine-5'-phosphate decarboxylase
MAHVFDRLSDACRASGSRVCVGLDPHLDLLPPDEKGRGAIGHVRAFLSEILAAIEGLVPCVKPQVAFFEALGPEGFALYFDVIREAHRRGFFVIGDVKRADIGSTAAAYAQAHLAADDGSAADAVTLNPYLGVDSIEPFLKVGRAKGRGVFVLARTSNGSAKEFQDVGGEGGPAARGEPLFLRVGRALEKWGGKSVGARGFTDVGAVVGATHPDEGALLRRELPKTFFLVPGFGAQGASAADVARTFDSRGEGAIVNSSRGVLFAWKDAPDPRDGAKRFAELARAAAQASTRAIDDALAARAPRSEA